MLPGLLTALWCMAAPDQPSGRVDAGLRIAPMPAGERSSDRYRVTVDGRPAPVYVARVAPRDEERRWKAMDDKANSALYYEEAAFTTFDMARPVRVVVTCTEAIRSAKLLPASAGIRPLIRGRTLAFRLDRPRPITVEVNGEWVRSLHILASPPERNPPRPDDPNVIYYGPGIHEVRRVVVHDGQTVYIAPGAVVRAVIGPDEPYQISDYSGLKTYPPTFELRGSKVTFRGRGILDGSGLTTHARNLLYCTGRNVEIEGVILRDSPTWNLPIRQSDHVRVRNLKIIGYRANSDGIDICNSRDVTVEDCFLRTLDDLIVVKTDAGQGKAARIAARRCVLWNEVAHALSVGAELREDVDDVLFEDCDVIHDKGREWTLRVYHCDAARITNVRWINIRIEETRRLISLWINKAVWTRDEARGHISDIEFRDITAAGQPATIELLGYDAEHRVERVVLRGVRVNGRDIARADVQTNKFVDRVTVQPDTGSVPPTAP
ncbi:MAG: endo-polygalacturonase [Chthonomonadales bacterium]|nr:endo-polygalacturonase [Chthonomonadales bacterium]